MIHKLQEFQHNFAVRSVEQTPPLAARDDGVVIFSMMGTRVLWPYLVAIKSLDHFLQRGRVVILSDGTLTDDDRAILRDHLDAPQILEREGIDTKGCPTYSSWARLFALLELRRDNYVIQLDSDTVTIGDVPQLRRCVDERLPFILRGEAGAEFADPADIAAHARRNPSYGVPDMHVQLAMEGAMDQVAINGLDAPRYVRGCAGFAGFAPDASGSDLAERFSAEAARLIGFDKWKQWGSEQVTSNFLIANSPGAQLLPYDHYCNFWDEDVGADMRFIHFIGTYRYRRGLYSDVSRRMIRHLRG